MTSLSEIESPLVSIIIVNFNGRRFIENCLNSVLRTKCIKFEVIVVDNGSTDESLELLQNFSKNSFVGIKIIKNKINLGFAEGNNVGVENSIGKYIAFLNNDTAVDSNWLQSMVTILESHEQIAAVQSLLLTRDGMQVDSLGGVIDIFGTAKDEVVRFDKVKRWVSGEFKEIFSACAAAMLVRRDIFEAIGGFDPHFFMYYEDVDLSWRIRLYGFSIVLDSSSIVYHMRGETSKKFKTNMFSFHLFKNQMTMLIKNYETKSVLQVIPGLLSIYFFRVMYSLIKNDANLGIVTIKALSWNIKELPYILSERKYIQTYVRRVGDNQIRKLMSKKPLQLLRIRF